MFSEIFYLLRSKTDGKYLVARANEDTDLERVEMSYLLLFREHFDALSYLNKYAGDVSNRFAVESIPGSQLPSVIKRWGFGGVGIVQDPLLPRIEFLVIS